MLAAYLSQDDARMGQRLRRAGAIFSTHRDIGASLPAPPYKAEDCHVLVPRGSVKRNRE